MNSLPSKLPLYCLLLAATFLTSERGVASPEDRQAIRDASGRYKGGLSGTFLFGESVNSFSTEEQGVVISTRLPRKKGKFKNRLNVDEFEGFEGDLGTFVEIEARITKIKVRGKKIRYRGVLKLPEPLGLDKTPSLVGLLNATAKKKRSGHKLTYPITLSRLVDADDYDFLTEDVQLAIFLNFEGEK